MVSDLKSRKRLKTNSQPLRNLPQMKIDRFAHGHLKRAGIYREKWDTPSRDRRAFCMALRAAMRRHGDDVPTLLAAIAPNQEIKYSSLCSWVRGDYVPRQLKAFEALERVEDRYRLPRYYFKTKLLGEQCELLDEALKEISEPFDRVLKWHLPNNFARLPVEKQKEILDWIRANVLACTTDYTRYLSWTSKNNFGINFPGIGQKGIGKHISGDGRQGVRRPNSPQNRQRIPDAPPNLTAEVKDYFVYKTEAVPPRGYRRLKRWNGWTAEIKARCFRTLFGALCASSEPPTKGANLPVTSLSFGMLIFPAVWDWIFSWREARRSFLTRWEQDCATELMALTRRNTGWLRQNPGLAARLCPLSDLVSSEDVEKAKANWDQACDAAYEYAKDKASEIGHQHRLSRDPVEAILPILDSPSPMGEYRKIVDEILKRMPDQRQHPLAAAEAMRSYLILRLGLHMGVRQRNLRDLRLCPKGATPSTEHQLEVARHGEIRWIEKKGAWEIFIPVTAFKNPNSSFFQQGHYQLLLPRLAGLNKHIDAYINVHRSRLLAGFSDPGTLFVRTVRTEKSTVCYSAAAFYEAWKLAIQFYGIHNPYTKRGALKGVLPHGPHCVRDVLATHVLKQTGSYSLAGFAIQATADTVFKHYGRFMPREKIARAAMILNEVWRNPHSPKRKRRGAIALEYGASPVSKIRHFVHPMMR